MPVKIVVKGGTVKDALKQAKKSLGDSIGNFGGTYADVDRCPTGVFPFDMATGGGIPRGRTTIIYGPESSCKTNLAFRAIAMNQKIRPHETNVYIAIEPFDGKWAQKMGVDTDKLVVLKPSYAEQAVDLAEQFLGADDIGIMVIDSLAAMITTQEAEKSAEGFVMGGSAVAVGKLVRRTTLVLNEAEKLGRSPTLVYINQTRFKIGTMHGDPETMPGGNAPKFQAALWVRVRGKNITDKKVTEMYPVRKEVHFTIKKNKLPILADAGMFELVTYPHDNLSIGDTDDFGTLLHYLKDWELLEKSKKGWAVLGEEYPTQQAFMDRMRADRAFADEVRRAVIETAMTQKEGVILQPSPSVDADGVVSEEA